MNTIADEKLALAADVLDALDIDCWLTFVRETTESGDPVLPLILGQPLTWQSALIVTRRGERIAIVGKHEDEAVASSGCWPELVPYVQGICAPLRAALDRIAPRSIAVNYSKDDVKADGLSHGMYLLLLDHLAGTPHADRLIGAQDIVRAVRGRKSPSEVERIRAAIATTDELFEQVARYARPGVTERAVWSFLHDRLAQRAIEPAWEAAMCPIVTTGPDSMVGHGLPSSTLAVTPGGVFHLDFGVRQNEYCSDLQRVWYVPEACESAPPGDVCRAFDAVRASIKAAFAALRPGTPGHEVDAAARSALTGAGYDEYQHATGHHVGRAAHDGGGVIGPKWERYGRTPDFPLEVGNVVTLELGVDVPGRGYLGLEEMALVTASGAEWLSKPQEAVFMLPVD